MKNLLIFTFIFIALNLNAQCDELTERFGFPVMHSINSPLTPDPCDALSDYGTIRELTIAPSEGYQEIKKRIRVVTETTWDADHCIAETVILSRDTSVISEQIFPSHSNRSVGGFWTIRMELLVMPPNSRPSGSFATKLPKGSMSMTYKDGTNLELKDYWVVHTGRFENQSDAKIAVQRFKELHPEFCRAYAYWLPSGCLFQYRFNENLN